MVFHVKKVDILDEGDFLTVKVGLLKKGLKEAGIELKGSNVLILGVTYRGDVKETRCSPACSIIDILKRKGVKVFACDPLLEKEVTQYGAVPHGTDDLSEIDGIIIAADHREFKNMDWAGIANQMRHKVLIDGRQVVDPKVRAYGFIFYGIGVR